MSDERVYVDFWLRSHQMDFLREVGRINHLTLSDALAFVLESSGRGLGHAPKAPHKHRFHAGVSTEHMAMIRRQSVQLGLVRSDVVRRMIDEAMNRSLPA